MSAAGIAIRPAVPGDAVELSRMSQEFVDELDDMPVARDAPEIPEPDDIILTPDILARDVFGVEPLAHVLMAEQGGATVGYLMYHFGYWPADAAPSLHVVDLFVRAGARKRGVARAMMKEALAIIRRRGGHRLLWTVWDQNHPAIAFYERLGARFFSEERLMTLRVGISTRPIFSRNSRGR
jgi:GNAT superfamily N-acetyltransferase